MGAIRMAGSECEWTLESYYRTPTDEGPVVRSGIESQSIRDLSLCGDPTMHVLHCPPAGFMLFGIGAGVGIVEWCLNPPNSRSVFAVNHSPIVTGLTSFHYLWEEMTFEPSDVFPANDVIAIVLHFFEHRALPENVTWSS